MTGPLGLPFRQAWAVDFEFDAGPGEQPDPVCMVARELGTGQLLRLWIDELDQGCPFPVDDTSLIVAYLASAELGCMLRLGWPLPRRILDLYVEYRHATNGLAVAEGRSLLGALAYHRLPGITSAEKKAGRDLVMRGGPWSSDERDEILDYCQTDVDCLGPLLARMLPVIAATPQGLGQALLRGRYMAAVARMEAAGVPIDVAMLDAIREHLDDILGGLIAEVDSEFGVFDGTTFRDGLFAAMLADRGVDWPTTPTGRMVTDDDTFRDMCLAHPWLEPLRQLRVTRNSLRPEQLTVGGDGRNRTLLSPFGAVTGRNTPSNARFIFGPQAWMRGLIKPTEGRALAYIDYTAQEVTIAAGLSGDPDLLKAVASGDPYLAFATMAGLAPAGAGKTTHAQVRAACKTALLGANYGMGARTLSYRIGGTVDQAAALLRALARTFPVFWAWSEHVVDVGMLTGRLSTVFGWTMHLDADTRATTLRNYLMQSNGAEMLRLACCLVTEAGITVCAPVHDALLIEAADDELDDAVEITRILMGDASAVVLDGVEVATDVVTIRWPGRYSDPRGQDMWDRIEILLKDRPMPAHSRFEEF
jgi:hypothetical protein